MELYLHNDNAITPSSTTASAPVKAEDRHPSPSPLPATPVVIEDKPVVYCDVFSPDVLRNTLEKYPSLINL